MKNSLDNDQSQLQTSKVAVHQETYTLQEASQLIAFSPDILRQAVCLGELKGKVLSPNCITITHDNLMVWLIRLGHSCSNPTYK